MSRNLSIVALEILEGCNLFCDFCVRNAHNNLKNKVDMQNLNVFLSMLDKFPEKPHIAITGGEPFLQGNLLNILKRISDCGFKFSITTNATIRNKEIIDFCANSDFFKHFIISVDSYQEETHDSIRGPKAFKRTQKFIDYLRENNIPFGINMTVSEQNYLDVDQTIKFSKNIGAKDISVATAKPNGRGEATFNLNKLNIVNNQILKNKELIDENFKLWATEVTFFLYDMDTYRNEIINGEKGSCGFGRATLHIRANGDVLGCTACEDKVLGNIFETVNSNFLLELWNNDQLLEDVRSKKYLSGICSSCEYKDFCGGCRCRAYGVNDDLFGDDPYCPIVIEKAV